MANQRDVKQTINQTNTKTMSTKKLFLMAAMLLASVCAFAQSVNNEPLRGDVNDDGKVDIADVTELVNIILNKPTPQVTYYWYVGTTQPTAENYKTIASEVSSYADIYEYTSKERTYHYILVAEDIPIVCRDKSDLGVISITEITSVNIPGHKVYKTNGALSVGGTVCIDLGDEWKHFYFGTTQPTADNYVTITPQYSSLSDMIGATVHVPSGGKAYLLFPYSDSPSIRQLSKMITDSDGNGVSPQSGENNVRFVGSVDYSSVDRHFIWELSVDNETTLTFQEQVLYFSVGTTVVNASNYTTVNDATTTIPETYEWTNDTGSKASVYVLAPSNKTVTIKDTNANIAFTDVYEDISFPIPNHKVWTKTSKVGNGGSITIILN